MRDIDLLQTKVPGELIDIALRGSKPAEFASEMFNDAQGIVTMLGTFEKKLAGVADALEPGLDADEELRELVRRSESLIAKTHAFAEGQAVDTPEFASCLESSAARLERLCSRLRAALVQAEE